MKSDKAAYVTMNVYWLGLDFMWNALHPIVLPALLLRFVPESLKNTYLGGLTFAGLILAMVVQPLAGGLSDRYFFRWGRRRPWILAGTALDLIVLAGMAAAGSFWGLLVTYLALQIFSNVAHGPAQGLIPDLVPEERHGVASGIKNLFDMGGLVVASLVAGQLMGAGNATLAFVAMGVMLAVCAAVTLLGTHEAPPDPAKEPQKSAAGNTWRDLFRADFRRYPAYAWLIVSRFLILLGIYAVQGFAQYYIRDVLAVSNPAEVTGNLLAIIGLALTFLVFPAGLLADRFGRDKMNLIAGALCAVGIFSLVFVRSVSSLFLFGGIIGMGTGLFVSANWALAIDLIPKAEAGKYLGLSNLATAGAAAVGRLAGPLIDGLNAYRPGAYLGYPVFFVLASVSALVGTVLVLRIRSAPRVRPTEA
jgi:MFS family permease